MSSTFHGNDALLCRHNKGASAPGWFCPPCLWKALRAAVGPETECAVSLAWSREQYRNFRRRLESKNSTR